MSKIKQEDISLWQSISHELKRNIHLCIRQLKENPIITYPPDDFDLKKNKIKTTIQDGEIFDEEEYLDVFAFMLEERSGVSSLQLQDEFANTFGKTNEYWHEKIQKWAINLCFSSQFTIWTVNGFMKNYVNYVSSPIQRDNIDQWRRKVISYISSLEFLIKKINKLKTGDSPYPLDEAYVKYHKQKNVYKTFVQKIGIVKLSQNENSRNFYGEESNVTFQNRSKAEKKLFNFPSNASRNFDDIVDTSKNQKKPIITLDKYFGTKKNQVIEEVEIPTDKQQREEKYREFVRLLKNIGKNEGRIEDLRKDLYNQKEDQEEQRKIRQENEKNEQMMKTSKKANLMKRTNQQKSESQIYKPAKFTVRQIERLGSQQQSQFPINHLLFIHDNRDFFHFTGYPIAQRPITISNPFILYPWVNYWINDEEEYEEITAVELDDNIMDSDEECDVSGSGEGDSDEDEFQDDSIQNDETFIDNRRVIIGGYGDDSHLAPEDRIQFKNQIKEGDQKWVIDFRKQPNLLMKDDEESNKFVGLKVVPVYGGELPYPIQGTDDPRTKRRLNLPKSKNTFLNSMQNVQYPMEEIIENSEEDNSTTNLNSNSRPEAIFIMEPIQQVSKQDIKHEKSTDLNGVQTTFEEKVQEQSFQNHHIEWMSKRMEVEQTKEYEEIRCLSSILKQNEIKKTDQTIPNNDEPLKEYNIIVRSQKKPSQSSRSNQSGRKKSEHSSAKKKQPHDNKDVQI